MSDENCEDEDVAHIAAMPRVGEWSYWTLLPRLDLRGVSTCMVESIDHYLGRLCWLAGVGRPTLLQMVDWDEVRVEREHPRTGYSGQCAPDYLPELTALTGQEQLPYGCLWKLRDVLSLRSFGRTRRARRWCPTCFLEWDETRSAEPLIFQIDVCRVCPVHGCALIEFCDACGSSQQFGRRFDTRMNCHQCGESLGFRAEFFKLPEIDAWAQREIEAVVTYCSTPGEPAVDPDAFHQYVNALERNATEDGATSPLLRQIRAVRGRVHTNTRPSLRLLLNFAALQGVSVMDILHRPLEAASRPLLDRWAEQSLLPLDMGSFRYRGTEAMKLCQRLLRLSKVAFLPPLEFILKDLGISTETFREHRLHVYRDYLDGYEGQGGENELYAHMQLFKAALGMLDGQPLPLVRVMGWRIRCQLAQEIGRTPGSVAWACRGAIAYYRLVQKAKDRLGVPRDVAPARKAYRPVSEETPPCQFRLDFVWESSW